MNKSKASNLILLSFFIILSLSAIVTELFRTPTAQKFNLDNYHFVFKKNDLEGLFKIVFKNSLGTFHISKSEGKIISPWELKYPRELPAREDIIKNIIQSLEKLKIRKIYKRDPINISNFSLDPPLMEFTLINKEKNEFHLQLGLVDSITDSTYITFKNHDIIYQIDSISFPLEKMDLSDFIETKIFTTQYSNIKQFSIFQRIGRTQKIKKIRFKKNNENKWFGIRGLPFPEETTKKFLEQFINLKSTIILDAVTASLQKKIDRYLYNPLYSVTVQEDQGNEIKYQVSTLIGSLPGIKMEKGQYFIIKASNRKFSFLVHKDSFPIFSKRENQLYRGKI